MTDQFYVTLPSDSSQTVYGRQSPSSFRTALAREVDVSPSGWEVGLAEFAYPKNWLNVTRCVFTVTEIHPDTEEREGVVCELPDQRCEGGAELVHSLKKAVDNCLGTGRRNRILVEYLAERNRVRIAISSGFELVINDTLSLLLGFDNVSDGVLRTGTVVGSKNVDPHREQLSMYLYADIAEHMRVGHAHVPLLRIVPDDGLGGGGNVTERFNPVHYVGLQRGRFESIYVRICDRHGRDVSFSSGRTIVTLHFRRKKT